MTASSLIARDGAEILQCPGCRSPGLTVAADDLLSCPACGARFPLDPRTGVCAFVAGADGGGIKDDIRRWWGDLYQQLYAENDQTLDPGTLARQLVELEDLFDARRHLATVEMPVRELAGKSVLEIGSGGGGHSALFQAHGASVVAVDITPERVVSTAAKLAMGTGGEGRAYVADAENLPFRDDSFDIVYSNGVLHHSEDTARCVAEVHRVLKPGGLAVIMLYSRHSAVFWLSILPRALLSGDFFRFPEAQWVGRQTEGTPKFGETKNPITRVYSARQMRALFDRFQIASLRKSSFQFDNFAVPKLTQIRSAVLRLFGRKAHPGGILVYGAPFVPETALELWLGRAIGFCWNVVARK